MTYDFSDARQHAPATQRNRRPIVEVLETYLPQSGLVLEIASGTGEHACFFANHLSHCQWLPSDINDSALKSIEAWRSSIELPNLYSPILLDVTESTWPVEQESFELSSPTVRPDSEPTAKPLQGSLHAHIQAIVNINMIHISPWSACESLFAGAERLLPPGGILYLYGPFKRDDVHTAPSNAAFDQSLRSRNPKWGIRDLDQVTTVAERHGFSRKTIIPMPANNFSVIFTATP